MFFHLVLLAITALRVQSQSCYGWGNIGGGYCDDFCENGRLVADYSGNCRPDVRPPPSQ
jgi:hypothetical protein